MAWYRCSIPAIKFEKMTGRGARTQNTIGPIEINNNQYAAMQHIQARLAALLEELAGLDETEGDDPQD